MKKKSDFLKYTDYQFDQGDCSYKVNTDTIALGLFLDPLYNQSVLDIGTNTGALLLYALDKKAKHLHGVDIHQDALKIARKNLKRYADDFHLYHCRIQDLDIDKVDTIICNPPFFEMNHVTDDEYVKEAMFEDSLPPDDLFSCFRRLMKDNGTVYLIYQADRFPSIYGMCLKYRLKIMKMAFVHDVHSRHALRVLLKLKIGRMSKLKIEQPVLIDSGEFIGMKQK